MKKCCNRCHEYLGEGIERCCMAKCPCHKPTQKTEEWEKQAKQMMQNEIINLKFIEMFLGFIHRHHNEKLSQSRQSTLEECVEMVKGKRTNFYKGDPNPMTHNELTKYFEEIGRNNACDEIIKALMNK